MGADVNAGPVEDNGPTESELLLVLVAADLAAEIGRLRWRDGRGAPQHGTNPLTRESAARKLVLGRGRSKSLEGMR